MGYYIFCYGIKTDQVLGAFNSKDETLLKEVEGNDLFQDYADFEVNGFATRPDQALADIIQGNPFDNRSNYAYGYAVIGLCATLGTALPYTQEIKLGHETDLINKVLKEDFGILNLNIEEEFFEDNSHPFPIPKMDDWPLIGLIKHKQLGELKSKMSSLNITDEQIEALEDDPDEKGFAYEHLKGILENLNYCLDHHLDLVSFCH